MLTEISKDVQIKLIRRYGYFSNYCLFFFMYATSDSMVSIVP